MRVHEYSFRTLAGASMPLERFKGQPILLVNTASECGFTPQYRKLQALWEEYRPAGLLVLGVPCNDFGQQEPADNPDIEAFCSTEFGVTFPLTEKQAVLGRTAHPLFAALREEYGSDVLPRWNFFKYLFGRDGEFVAHWPSQIEPDEPGFRHDVERNLGSWTI